MKTRFSKLWEQTCGSVTIEIRKLVEKHDKNLVKNINEYYKVRLLKGLWYSTTFVTDYNEFMADLEKESPEKFKKIKQYLFENTTLINQDEESKIVSSIMSFGGLGTLLSLCKKNKKLLIISLGVVALAYFYNRFNQDKIISEANKIVTQKMKEIGQRVERILDE